MWSDVLGVLTTALEISQVSVTREAYLEAELLLNIGKFRLLWIRNFICRFSDLLLNSPYCGESTNVINSVKKMKIALLFRKEG